MSVSLGMNGFGRIGRYLLRLLADSEDIRITHDDNSLIVWTIPFTATAT